MQEHVESLYVIEKLRKAGFEAYYAGGWVRDFLLQIPSDDLDIATSASPEEVQKIFSKTVPIGISFGVVLVLVGSMQFEVSTFRKDLEYRDGRRPEAVEYSDIVEDAKRRDFTINGMFYDPMEKKVLDFIGGQQDLNRKTIRAIGDANERFEEDRLRMIRAVRMSCRFGFTIEEKTKEAILAHAKTLFPSVAIERVWQEIVKMAPFGIEKPFVMMQELGLLQQIFPQLKKESIEEISNRLSIEKHFPKKTPVIGRVLVLFNKISKKGVEELCGYLHLSRYEESFALFLQQTIDFLKKEEGGAVIEEVEWVYFYANIFSDICISIFSERYEKEKKKTFLSRHLNHKKKLADDVERIRLKKPVVKAKDLMGRGIVADKRMGLLLKEAEKISINEGIDRAEDVLKRMEEKNLL